MVYNFVLDIRLSRKLRDLMTRKLVVQKTEGTKKLQLVCDWYVGIMHFQTSGRNYFAFIRRHV